MKSWIISVCSVVFLTSIIKILIPKGKTFGLIKGLFSLIVVLIILEPVFDLKNNDFEFNDFFQTEYFSVQENYLYSVYEKKTKKIEEEGALFFKNQGVDGVLISVRYSLDDNYQFNVEKVEINLKNASYNTDKEHIDIINEAEKEISALIYDKEFDFIVYE